MKELFVIPEEIQTCITRINDVGYEAYIVGGAVRDSFLHRPIHDYDLATDALVEQLRQIFSDYKIIDTGIKHGTITVIVRDTPIEITTFRKDTTYSDHRHPDTVLFTPSLYEDCARRDFTINAMAYHPQNGLFDFFHGKKDLEEKRIRTVNDPSLRFEEDALRILRALRFAAQLDFTIEEKTKAALIQHKNDLFYIAMERIASELDKILESPSGPTIIEDYKEVFEVFLPELQHYSTTSFSNTIAAMKKAPRNKIIQMALLLQPIQEYLHAHFYKRLKFSNQYAKEIKTFLTNSHLPLDNKISIRKALHLIPEQFDSYLQFRFALEDSLKKDEILQYYREIIDNHDVTQLSQLALTGADLVNVGYEGEMISKGLQICLDAVMEERCSNQRTELLTYLKTIGFLEK